MEKPPHKGGFFFFSHKTRQSLTNFDKFAFKSKLSIPTSYFFGLEFLPPGKRWCTLIPVQNFGKQKILLI